MRASAFYGTDTARVFITFSVRPFAYHDGAGITGLAAGTGQGDVMTATAPFRVGGWLPADQAFLDQWVGDLVAKVEAESEKPLLPVVDEFRRLIEEDPEVYMLFRFMLEQVPYHKAVPDLRACCAASFPGPLSGWFACVLMIGPAAQS
jgi:hypothetical protein